MPKIKPQSKSVSRGPDRASRAPPNENNADRATRQTAAGWHDPNPFKFYRVNRLAELFGVRRETIWRWEKNGLLPRFKQIGSLRGLTEEQVAQVFEQRHVASPGGDA
ncbi:helix-turn-helix transcriptional regulator [Nitrobacter sp. JJSN]|uniref:helix-turn-helix transcriptional regulator n=1 Tax=Nitrobacter sp. JJSN TaxID=3453033 RepID=UPI003F75B323